MRPVLRLAADQRVAPEPLDDFVEGHRGLAAVFDRANRHLLTRQRVEPDRALDVVAISLGNAIDDREILLVDLSKLELKRQPPMRELVFDDDEQARRVAVEPVDDARPILAGDGRECVIVKLEGVDQGPLPVPLAGCVTMPGGLLMTVRNSSS